MMQKILVSIFNTSLFNIGTEIGEFLCSSDTESDSMQGLDYTINDSSNEDVIVLSDNTSEKSSKTDEDWNGSF